MKINIKNIFERRGDVVNSDCCCCCFIYMSYSFGNRLLLLKVESEKVLFYEHSPPI